jgi:short-subunit dehydrogenase
MSKIFIPRFKQRAAKSAFINMASCSGFFACSRLGLYSATKTMTDVFSRIITK